MTYLLNTSRKATAVLGSVFGNFDGTGEYHHLILNCVTRLEIWELKVSDLEKAAEQQLAQNAGRDVPPPMAMLGDIPVNGTIKHLLAVPIPVARAAKHPRLCLFLVTEKQDVCILGLNRVKADPTQGINGGLAELVPETLYSTNIGSSLFHRHFGQTSLCVSSHPVTTPYGAAADRSYPSSTGGEEDVSPLVALSQIRNYVILFDIAACIVDGASMACSKRSKVNGATAESAKKRGRNGEPKEPQPIASQRTSGGLNSNNDEDDTVANNVDVISQSTATTALTINHPPQRSQRSAAANNHVEINNQISGKQDEGIHDSEPTDAEIGQQLQTSRLFSLSFIGNLVKKRSCLPFSYCPVMEAEPRSICLQRSTTYGKSLAVLFQDPRGRTHIRRYTVTEQPLNSGSTQMAESSNTGGTTGHTMLLQRQIPMLAPIFDRTVLRLVTKSTGLVLTKGCTLQNDVESDAMYLHAMPNGVLVVGSILATYIDTEGKGAKGHVTTTITPNPYARSEPVAVQSVSPISCVVGYVNGALVVCRLDDGERGEIGCHLLTGESTPMTSLVTIGDYFFAASAYHSSVFVSKNTGACTLAIPNTGPIVEMNVLEGGGSQPSMSMVAATGVEHFTSLQVIREAVPVNEEAVIDGLPGVVSLHSVPSIPFPGESETAGTSFGVLALSFATETRMMLFEDGPTLSLEEVDFMCEEPTLCLGRVAPTAVIHVTGSGAQLLHVTTNAIKQSGPRVAFPNHANLAITDPQCSTLLVVTGREVAIYELPSLQCLHTIVFPYQVASIEMTSSYEVLVGLWECNKIQMFSAEDLTPFDLVVGLPMLPRSLKLTSLVRSQYMADASATLDRASLTDRHLFIGFTDGSIGVIPISVHVQQPVAGKLQHLALGSQPVAVHTILNSNRIPSGVLCTGDVPGVLFASNSKGVTSSGFGARALDSVAQLTASTFATYDAAEGKMIISTLDTKIQHRVNAIGTPIRQTVPKLKLMTKWNNLLLAAQRESQQDSIVPYYVMGGVVKRSSRVTAALALLESERCEFIEWLELNGAPFVVADGEVNLSSCSSEAPLSTSPALLTSAFISNKAEWDPAKPFAAALLGTNFSYPNEDIPRNGRILLVGMERVNNKMTMIQLAERDIRGMVLSACMVPRTNNRILVGVTGCVHMYRWSPADKSFVFEISTSFGAAVTKLIPLSGSSLGAAKARPQLPQIVAATPAVRAPARPQSQTSQRTLGGFGNTASNPSSPTIPLDEAPLDENETSSLVLCADIRNSLAIIALNPVELIRVEASERTYREILDVVPAGNKPFVEKQSGLKVYDPHFISSDTNLNLFIISSVKEKKPATERGSIYELQGQIPQLGVCGQIHVGDRITVLQRGTLQATKKMKANYARQKGSTVAVLPMDALDRASASAAATNTNENRWRKATSLPDLTEKFKVNAVTSSAVGGTNVEAPPISEGVRDTSMPTFVYGTVHGAIGSLTPINPLAFNYLSILQRVLIKCIKPVGNLSYENFKRIYNRETSSYVSTSPHFAEGRDAVNVAIQRKNKAYNFIDGDVLSQFVISTSASSSYGLNDSTKSHAVHMTNKALRAAAFSGELFVGTSIDHKRLGLGSNGGSSPTEDAPGDATFSAVNQQPPPSSPTTPLTLQPQQHVDPTDMATGEHQTKKATDVIAKRTTFTPNEIEHLNELLTIAELPEYPLTVESCERFLADLQRFC